MAVVGLMRSPEIVAVYGSAAEASQDKSGKQALQQYRLYDLEEVALARNIHGMVLVVLPVAFHTVGGFIGA